MDEVNVKSLPCHFLFRKSGHATDFSECMSKLEPILL